MKPNDDVRTKLGELFSYSEAVAAGVSRRRLYALRDEGILTVVGTGLYRFSDAPPADLDLIEIAEKAPLATLCLETALARHDLVDTIPAATNIAIPRGSTRPQLRAAHRLHHFDPTTFELGRQLLDVGARKPLGLYSAERTIVDMVRLRHEQGPEQAWEALRRWLARPGRNLGQLLALAGQFAGAEAPLRAALEVLL
ncbi:MAG: type IV toxin-antitoxin system AbiEi family antitoxin domain-containing protein [Myxococcales bacterium]|nr:type IV toxin-antitoxin system AbiEi family antitoxin domain-containing protein [Myxococcales bacterium]